MAVPVHANHAIQRAYERYRLKLNVADLRALAMKCAEQPGIALPDGTERHVLSFHNKLVTVVYRPRLEDSTNLASPYFTPGFIVTFLPMSAAVKPIPTKPTNIERKEVMARKPATGLAYALERFDPPRDMRTAAAMTCSKCDTKGKIPVVNSNNNPEKIAQWFKRLGWECDGFHASQNLCPKCIERRELRRKQEIAQEERERTPGRVLVAPLPKVAVAAPRHFEDVVLGASTRTGGTITKIADLTREQKAEVRKELDSHFDEENGRYLDEYSDQIIADGLGIPRKVIEQFREDLYGPIMRDPEIEAIEATVADAKRTMANLQSSINRLETKIDELKKKRG